MDIKKSIKEYYEKESSIESWSKKGKVEDALDLYGERSQNRALFEDVSICGTVLDLASGTAHYGRKAKLLGADKVICVDISYNMLLKARQLSKGFENIHFVQADADRLPFKGGTFDVIINVGLFAHLEETDNVINELHFVIKTGGSLVVRFLNGASLPGMAVRIRALLNRRVPFGYPFYRMYSRREALGVLEGKFRVQQVRSSLLIPLPIIPGVILGFIKKNSGNWFIKTFLNIANKVEKLVFKNRISDFFSYCFVVVFKKAL